MFGHRAKVILAILATTGSLLASPLTAMAHGDLPNHSVSVSCSPGDGYAVITASDYNIDPYRQVGKLIIGSGYSSFIASQWIAFKLETATYYNGRWYYNHGPWVRQEFSGSDGLFVSGLAEWFDETSNRWRMTSPAIAFAFDGSSYLMAPGAEGHSASSNALVAAGRWFYVRASVFWYAAGSLPQTSHLTDWAPIYCPASPYEQLNNSNYWVVL